MLVAEEYIKRVRDKSHKVNDSNIFD